MKSVFLAIFTMTLSFGAQAAVTCRAGDYRIDVNGSNAVMSFISVKVGEINNIQASTAGDTAIYTSDLQFRLEVKPHGQGMFLGFWPNPAQYYTSGNPLLLKCR